MALSDDISNLEIDPNHWVLTRSFSQDKLQMGTCLAYDGAVDLTWFPWPGELSLAGYHVHRKLMPDGEFQQLTDAPLTNLAFTDINVTNGNTYLYRITAEDMEGFQTQPSNVMEARPIEFLFDQGVLIVDNNGNVAGYQNDYGARLPNGDHQFDAIFLSNGGCLDIHDSEVTLDLRSTLIHLRVPSFR